MEILEEVEEKGSLQPRSSTHTSQEGLLVPRDPSILGVMPVVGNISYVWRGKGSGCFQYVYKETTQMGPQFSLAPDIPLLRIHSTSAAVTQLH